MYTSILTLNCHVKPVASALVTVVIDGISQQFNLLPTINWVASSSTQDSHEMLINLPVSDNMSTLYNFDFEIKSEYNDILIGGYNCTMGNFNISTQPVWDDPRWQPYDISGHNGVSPAYSGPGSLQILAGQTVKFKGTLTTQYSPLLSQNG